VFLFVVLLFLVKEPASACQPKGDPPQNNRVAAKVCQLTENRFGNRPEVREVDVQEGIISVYFAAELLQDLKDDQTMNSWCESLANSLCGEWTVKLYGCEDDCTFQKQLENCGNNTCGEGPD
jgi:hypothetical protein